MKLVICKWAHCINHTHNAHSLLNFSALWPRSDWGLRLYSSRVFHKSASRDCFDISESLCSCARGSPLISWVQSQKGTRGLAEAHVSYRISGRDSDTPWLTPVEQTLRSPDSRLCTRPTWVQITESTAGVQLWQTSRVKKVEFRGVKPWQVWLWLQDLVSSDDYSEWFHTFSCSRGLDGRNRLLQCL